ncbi:MAG: extensin family protein [Beijerinckiaceae bacterium]|nr:extensin family protein [Beijerinckiaceae bacterium]
MMLTERGALFTPVSRPKNQSPDDPCAIDEAVSLRGVRISDSETVLLDSAVIVRCELAAELALWVRDDLSVIARRHGASLRKLVGVGGQECRGRNRQSGARLSEHAIGNAFDIHKIELDGGRTIDIMKDRDDARRPLREDIKASACKRFPTVLGTGSDGFHEDHLHVDLRARRGGYRLCQWDMAPVKPPIAP